MMWFEANGNYWPASAPRRLTARTALTSPLLSKNFQSPIRGIGLTTTTRSPSA